MSIVFRLSNPNSLFDQRTKQQQESDWQDYPDEQTEEYKYHRHRHNLPSCVIYSFSTDPVWVSMEISSDRKTIK
jgi:hypothetical protein